MLVLKIACLVIAVVIATLVGVRNARRNFRPSFRSHIELFLAGIPVGFMSAILVLPEQVEAIYLAIACAFLAGAIISFSLPRRWQYWNESRLSKKE